MPRPKGIALIILKDHVRILCTTASIYSDIEWLKSANVDFEADGSPPLIPESRANGTLLIVEIPMGQKHSRRLSRNLSIDGVFLLKFLAIGIRGSGILTGDSAVLTTAPESLFGSGVGGGKVGLGRRGIFALEASLVSSVAANGVCRHSAPVSIAIDVTDQTEETLGPVADSSREESFRSECLLSEGSHMC